jgi:1-acyl-sn-glycerol-3-phosphate acyltransferase
MALLYETVGQWLIRPLLHVLYRAEVSGSERIPAIGPAILAANHESVVDPFVLGLTTPRVVRYMAKSELFESPLMRPLMRGFGTFPVERGRGDREAMARARELLEQGELVGMFPQGTIVPSRDRPFRRGAARLALETGVAIVPVCLVGTERVWRPHDFKLGLPTVRVLVASPIPVERRKPTIVASNELIARVEAAVLELRRPYGEPRHAWLD